MIHVLWGEDAFSIAAEERRLVDSLVEPSWRSVNLTVFDGAAATLTEVLNAARTPPFFGERLVVVRDCPWFTPAARKKKDAEDGEAGESGSAAEVTRSEGGSGDPAAGKVLVEALKEGLPAGCNLLLVVPRTLNKTLGATKALLEAASATPARAIVKEFPGPDPFRPERTVGWVMAHAREVGHGIDREAAELLVGRLGQDKYLLDGELQKLASYAMGRAVRVDDVALLSPPGESDVFKLLDEVAAGRLADAIVHLRRLMVHDHPLKILAAMSTYLRSWHQIQLMTERRMSAEDIGRAIKWHPYRVKKAQEALRRWSSRHLASALEALVEAELALKGSGYPEILVMERLLARLTTLWRQETAREPG